MLDDGLDYLRGDRCRVPAKDSRKRDDDNGGTFARHFDRTVAVFRTQQADVGAARKQLLDQHQICRVVFDI